MLQLQPMVFLHIPFVCWIFLPECLHFQRMCPLVNPQELIWYYRGFSWGSWPHILGKWGHLATQGNRCKGCTEWSLPLLMVPWIPFSLGGPESSLYRTMKLPSSTLREMKRSWNIGRNRSPWTTRALHSTFSEATISSQLLQPSSRKGRKVLSYLTCKEEQEGVAL